MFGVQLNLQKSSHLALQLHLVAYPVSSMEPISQHLPGLLLIPLAVKGTVNLGTHNFVNDAGRKELSDCDQQCQ